MRRWSRRCGRSAVPWTRPSWSGCSAAPAPGAGALTPGRLLELLLGVLHRLAERGPLLLVVEDLHWADQSTRDLLGFLVRNLRAGVALLLTYRSGGTAQRSGPLGRGGGCLGRGGLPVAGGLRPLAPGRGAARAWRLPRGGRGAAAAGVGDRARAGGAAATGRGRAAGPPRPDRAGTGTGGRRRGRERRTAAGGAR